MPTHRARSRSRARSPSAAPSTPSTRRRWDELAALNPYATPFSQLGLPAGLVGRLRRERARRDARGRRSCRRRSRPAGRDRAADGSPRRRAVRRGDAHDPPPRRPRPADPGPAETACAVYFGASYHADYATLLADPADLAPLPPRSRRRSRATGCCRSPRPRTRSPRAMGGDRPPPAAQRPIRPPRRSPPRSATTRWREGWTLNVEREDVCPVITHPGGRGHRRLLATLGKKERHEIRRKVRRAEAAGDRRARRVERSARRPRRLHRRCTRPAGASAASSHRRRGGDQSRRFIRRLFELFARPPERRPAGRPPRLPDRRRTPDRRRDPFRDRRTRSSTTTPASTRRRETCRPASCSSSGSSGARSSAASRRVDLLRGDEPYKYEWGAVDEPIQRILVRRDADGRARLHASNPARALTRPVLRARRSAAAPRRARPDPRRRAARDRAPAAAPRSTSSTS